VRCVISFRSEDNLRKLENQRWQDTLEGLEDIHAGRMVDGNKVNAWLESWGTENYKKQLMKCKN